MTTWVIDIPNAPEALEEGAYYVGYLYRNGCGPMPFFASKNKPVGILPGIIDGTCRTNMLDTPVGYHAPGRVTVEIVKDNGTYRVEWTCNGCPEKGGSRNKKWFEVPRSQVSMSDAIDLAAQHWTQHFKATGHHFLARHASHRI